MRPRETHIVRLIRAPAQVVYELLLDPLAIAQWKVPDGMRCHVHEFDARESGRFRISLTYTGSGESGKSSTGTDTYHGSFIRLVPNAEVVERMAFESADPSMRGWMTASYLLKPTPAGTEVSATHSGVPEGVSLQDNQAGWSMALNKLAALAEDRAAGKSAGAV